MGGRFDFCGRRLGRFWMADQGLARSASPTTENIRSSCSAELVSGGQKAMLSPIGRTNTPWSHAR
jgi:hypothetical protein